MKKVLLLVISCVLCLAIVLVVVFNRKDGTFLLEEKYYGKSSVVDVDLDKLKELIDNKESFAIFVYQPNCVTSANFEEVLNTFQKGNKISFYKISFSEVKDYFDFLTYYPSFVIYNKGKVVDFLETDKDEDIDRYQSAEAFRDWFLSYVEISDDYVSNENDDYNDEKSESYDLNDIELKKITLNGVVREKGKVNIYFFWGDGCPHCEEETKFFNSVKKEYGKYFNLYKYEVWYNKDNAEMVKLFASAMGESVDGVPYTIIGSKSFKGFNESSKAEMLEAIRNERNSDFDIYFDKLRK